MNTGFCELDQAYKRASAGYGSSLQGGSECRATPPQAGAPLGPVQAPGQASGFPSLTEGFVGDSKCRSGICTHCGRRDFAMSMDDMIIVGLAAAFLFLYFKKPT